MDAKIYPVTHTDAEWRKLLTPEQYNVMRHHGTEAPGSCALNYEKRSGIFTCAGCGQKLFVSKTKFESGTGWPSFTRPIDADHVVEKVDRTLFMKRTEVRSAHGDSHLGHVFNDGPRSQGGLRYCINSASLRFIHLDDLDAEGYGEYKKLFVKEDAK